MRGNMRGKMKKRESERERASRAGSFWAKAAAFVLLTVGSFVTAVSAMGFLAAANHDFYLYESSQEAFENLSLGTAVSYAYDLKRMAGDGVSEQTIRRHYESCNVDVDILQAGTETVLWSTNNGSYQTTHVCGEIPIETEELEALLGDDWEPKLSQGEYVGRVYIKPGLPNPDGLRRIYRNATFLYQMRYAVVGLVLGGGCLVLWCVLFLLHSAGKRYGERGRTPLDNWIFLDVLGGLWAVGLCVILMAWAEWIDYMDPSDLWEAGFCVGLPAAAASLWGISFPYLAAGKLKTQKWWRGTLVYHLCRGILRLFRGIRRAAGAVYQSLPVIVPLLAAFFALSFLEFLGCAAFVETEGVLLWQIEKLFLLALVIYLGVVWKRLFGMSKALAEGKQGQTLDTRWMFGNMKRHGENLNNIGYGISRAVEERMKSERLKTELIANVSHDLKTPLTSLINYSDLICQEETENERIREYAQVLFRQSERLKKLMDDLLEASKAATGNLEMDLQPCQVGVIWSQAVGEYQKRLEGRGLQLMESQPEEPVEILADGRQLWRVFDNLLNNICKYAQENSRVYFSVETTEREVRIIFRNMSQYPLNLSAQELTERFVRGDSSRHMEGNGLGLSIAASLVELQKGKMDIVVDGDLFKVTLCFPRLGA